MTIRNFVRKAISLLGYQISRENRFLRNWENPRPPEDRTGTSDRSTRNKILNLIAYTQTNNTAYRAAEFPGGYHSLNFRGEYFKGQRDPSLRISQSKIDFRGLNVLDLGCNAGGVLFEIADLIDHGTGLDYDYKLINTANRLKSAKSIQNIDFYVFDLDHESLDLANNFLVQPKIDVIFALSICMWLQNWKPLIEWARVNSRLLIFETNGSNTQQQEQIAFLQTLYRQVEIMNTQSEDDPIQKNRQLLVCKD